MMHSPRSLPHRNSVPRRASKVQRDGSFDVHRRRTVLAPTRSNSSSQQDFGLENFSYDASHLAQWEAPESLVEALPKSLREEVRTWQLNGAAVCTALERIAKLEQESMHRGYPENRTRHLSRSTSKTHSPTVPCTQSPSIISSPVTSSVSPSAMLPSPVLTYDNKHELLTTMPQRQDIGMESPPFTPLDSDASPTPANPAEGVRATLPDLHRITTELSPLSRSQSIPSPGTPTFDENAWETYINCFQAELEDVRSETLCRFKGSMRIIDRLRIELAEEAKAKTVVEEFGKWWETMKPKIEAYEKKVRELEVPDLDMARLERMAQGLAV